MVPDSGGTPQLVARIDDTEWARQPKLLDDRNVLFVVGHRPVATDADEIVVQSTDPATRTVLVRGGLDPRVTSTGQLLYLRAGALMSVSFDARRRQVSGDPVQVLDGVMFSWTSGPGQFAVSDAGTLAYWPIVGGRTAFERVPVWVNRNAKEQPVLRDKVPDGRHPRLSPDGTQLAIIRDEDLWVYPLDGRAPRNLTSEGAGTLSPLWTPDGQQILIERNPIEISTVATAGETPPVRVISGHYHPHGWSSDGHELLIVDPTTRDILKVRLDAPTKLQPVVQTAADEGYHGAALSPNGRWLAYATNQTGQSEIWVRPYSATGAAQRVSLNGGIEPVWARNGRELFYLEQNSLMAVDVDTVSTTFAFKPATRLFSHQFRIDPQPPSYDVAKDGRFLFIRGPGDEGQSIVIVQNWFQDLAARTSRK